MINLKKLAPVLDGYKTYFPNHWSDEKYKWEAIKHFQDNWNIDAVNFGDMFKKATDKTSNLLASGYAYPRAMITNFAKADDEGTRSMFRALFDESVDLAQRISTFQTAAEDMRIKYDDGTWHNHYQNTNAISTYLWLRFPDKYYIYKYELLRAAATELSSDYSPKKNGSVDSLIIKNIYYMLSYAFQVLKQSNYDEIASEQFDKIQDMFAAILSKGVAQQLKQGLYREYITKHETLSVMRGKLDMQETIRNRIQRKQKLACEFDELSENNLFNQILKTTLHYLVRDDGVALDRKAALKKLLVFFDGIELLEPSGIPWSRLYYQRNNRNYELLINICYFVLDGMLQTTDKGEYKMMAFSDEHMARLYERFILEYYRQHHTYLNEVKAAQVKWDIVGDNSDSIIRFLPIMQTDIFLRMKEKILILDAKYYGRSLQQQYDKYSLHSANVYQIFTYVKNQDKDNTGNVAGILLYAKTDEAITPDCMFNMGGNLIGAKTLDLNADFKAIAAQLDRIAEEFLGVKVA